VDLDVHLVASPVAPTFDKPSATLSFSDKTFTDEPAFEGSGPEIVSGCPDKKNEPLPTSFSSSERMGAIGLEPMTPSLSSWCSSQLS
jgi:hypothetical protein